MRRINTSDKITLYFKTSPQIWGEALLLIGIIMMIYLYPRIDTIGAMFFELLGIIGLFLLIIKFLKFSKNLEIIQKGVKTNCTLSKIRDTNISYQHHKKVLKFSFSYYADNILFTNNIQSSKYDQLKIGDRLAIYYLPDEPEKAVIPILFSLKMIE